MKLSKKQELIKISRHFKKNQTKLLEIKNVIEIKISVEELKSKIDTTAERICNFKHRAKENTQNAARDKKMWKSLVKNIEEQNEKVQYRPNQGSKTR